MKVTGNNLTNVCMMVYRVAKTEKNDQLFLEEDILSKIISLAVLSYKFLVHKCFLAGISKNKNK